MTEPSAVEQDCKGCKFWDDKNTVAYFVHHSYALCRNMLIKTFVIPRFDEQQDLMTHQSFYCKFYVKKGEEECQIQLPI